MNSKKTGLYIHFPFCIKKCAYCDFVSYENISCDVKKQYVDALLYDMKEYCGEEIDTVYLGGGTPTTMDFIEIKRVIDFVYENFKVKEDCEITIECNPKTADGKYFENLRKIGVNRLSIGVQSLSDRELSFLGRVHNGGEAKGCISMAKIAGFDNFSVDVMFGLPCQTIESLKNTLDGLLEFNPTHISCYSLIIEEGTPFYNMKIEPIDDDTEREMQDFIIDYLAETGYSRYEISNFAKNGKVSRHNIKYWEGVSYIGVGAAASSYYQGKRYDKESDIFEYIKEPAKRLNVTELTKEDEMSEFMFLGLRKTSGVSCEDFFEKFGLQIEEQFDISKHLANGFLVKSDGRIYLSKRGIDVSNAVLCDFV